MFPGIFNIWYKNSIQRLNKLHEFRHSKIKEYGYRKSNPSSAITDLFFVKGTNRVLIGYGDWDTNGGKISLVSFDVVDYSEQVLLNSIDTESISNFKYIDGKIFAPFIDPVGNVYGDGDKRIFSMYISNEYGEFEQKFIKNDMIHSFDIVKLDDSIALCGSSYPGNASVVSDSNTIIIDDTTNPQSRFYRFYKTDNDDDYIVNSSVSKKSYIINKNGSFLEDNSVVIDKSMDNVLVDNSSETFIDTSLGKLVHRNKKDSSIIRVIDIDSTKGFPSAFSYNGKKYVFGYTDGTIEIYTV